MTLEEKLKAKMLGESYDVGKERLYIEVYNAVDIALSICQQEIDEACKKAKIEENERWKLLAEKDEVDCHESFFISRISELWENAPSSKE